MPQQAGDGGGGALAVAGVCATGLYLLPTIVALLRHGPDRGTVLVLDVLLGWTLIGWVAGLAIAVRSTPRPDVAAPGTVVVGGPCPRFVPPSGWYADPHDPASQRWWDGSGWTRSTCPAPTPPARAHRIP